MRTRILCVLLIMISTSSAFAQKFPSHPLGKFGPLVPNPRGPTIPLPGSEDPVFSGGWTSGGGELMDNRSNPWFLQLASTSKLKVVPYCIVRDSSYPLTINALYQAVSGALSFWQDEFSEYYSGEDAIDHQDFYLGREKFIWDQSCSGNADDHDVDALPRRLIFQFGFLSPPQEAGLKDLGKERAHLVGIAVRTGYDEKALQGKGFIYITDKVKSENGVVASFNSNQLRKALIHELGHVYGLGHFGVSGEIMNEDYPHIALLNDDGFQSNYLSNVLVSKTQRPRNICFQSAAAKLFALSGDGFGCIRYKFDAEKTISLTLTEKFMITMKGPAGPPTISDHIPQDTSLGRIILLDSAIINVNTRIRVVTNIGGAQILLDGPAVATYAASAIYETDDGNRQPISIRLSPGGMELGVLMDDVMYFDVLNQSLILN